MYGWNGQGSFLHMVKILFLHQLLKKNHPFPLSYMDTSVKKSSDCFLTILLVCFQLNSWQVAFRFSHTVFLDRLPHWPLCSNLDLDRPSLLVDRFLVAFSRSNLILSLSPNLLHSALLLPSLSGLYAWDLGPAAAHSPHSVRVPEGKSYRWWILF